MKRYFKATPFGFLLLASFFLLGCAEKPQKATDMNCKRFAEGTFRYAGVKDDVQITRTATEQTEHSPSRNFTDTYAVSWISPCEYYLILKETTQPEALKMQVGDTLRVEITNLTSSAYEFVSIFKGDTLQATLRQVN